MWQTYNELLADDFEIVEAGETSQTYSKKGDCALSNCLAIAAVTIELCGEHALPSCAHLPRCLQTKALFTALPPNMRSLDLPAAGQHHPGHPGLFVEPCDW